MLTLNTKNIEKLGTEKDFSGKISPFLKQIHDRDQGFYSVIDDEAMVSEIEAYANKISGIFSDIVVLGIGGSALGTQTLRDSLRPTYENHPENPTLHILDNIDPDWIEGLTKTLDFSKTLFIVITKSGGTPETLSHYSYFKNQIESHGLSLQKHLVCITGNTGFLKEEAINHGLTTFGVPENVGGRFSVLTSVGLLPAALIGINIRKLLKGAQAMRDLFLSEEPEKNMPFKIASLQYELFSQEKTSVVMMPYIQRMKTFSDWYKQLLAESTGKVDQNGKNTGLTPMSALGVTDQHSQLQQFVQGINNKQFILLHQKKFLRNVPIPELRETEKTAFLKGKSFNQLLEAEIKGTADTLTENGRPNMTIEFETLNEEILGSLFLLFEGATAFLGEFLNINAFDQPGVERSKVLARAYLSK